MKRASVGVTVLGLFLLAAAPALASAIFTFTFEQGLSPWQSSFIAVPAPATSLSETASPSTAGTVSLSLLTEQVGSTLNHFAGLKGTPSGLFAMYAGLPNTNSTVRVKFQAKNLANCSGCKPVAFIGTNIPTSLAQFKVLSPGLTGDYQTYDYQKSLGPIVTNKIIVAVGYVNLKSDTVEAGFDNISVESFNP